jgi:hypothetical protein
VLSFSLLIHFGAIAKMHKTVKLVIIICLSPRLWITGWATTHVFATPSCHFLEFNTLVSYLMFGSLSKLKINSTSSSTFCLPYSAEQ